MFVTNPIENLLIWAGIFYFLPTVVALWRGQNFAPVFAINLFLGWTLIGWVGALAWAFAGRAQVTAPLTAQLPVNHLANTNRVLTTIVKTHEGLDLRDRLHVGEPVLLRPEADDRWMVLSEQERLGCVEGEAAKAISFRSAAIGMPRGKITRIDLDSRRAEFLIDLEIGFAG